MTEKEIAMIERYGGDRRSDEIREWKRKKREKGGLTVDLRFSEANYCHGEG